MFLAVGADNFYHIAHLPARGYTQPSHSFHMLTPLLTNLILVFFLMGVAAGSFRLGYPSPGAYSLLLGLLALSWFGRKKRQTALFWLLASLLLGWLFTLCWRTSRFTRYAEEETVLTGTIIAAPDIRADTTFLTVRPDQSSGYSLQGKPKKGGLLVKAPRYAATYRYGDRLAIEGKIKTPEKFDDFNYPLYLERYGIYGIIQKPDRIAVLESGQGNKLVGSLYQLRTAIEKFIQFLLPEPEASFLSGVLLGSKRAIPQDIQDALRQTGTSHIIAISGANITILVGLLLGLLPVYRLRSKFWTTAGIGGFVTVLTGASASVMRGSLVAFLSSYLKSQSRKASPTTLILSSMTLLILLNPLLLIADPGFQLSFAAFAGLAYTSGRLSAIIEKWPLANRLPSVIRSSGIETLAATIGTSFLSFSLFGQLSLIGLLVNPFILWLLPPITFLGLAVICLGWIPGIADLIRPPLWLLLHTVLSIIQWFGKLQLGVIRFNHE